MEKKTNLIEDVEDNKQSNEYLTQIYSEARRPFTSYPSKLRDYLIEKIIKLKTGKFLDVGCGRGDILKAFNELDFQCEGVDLSREAKKLCSPIKVSQVNLENSEIELLPKDFDIIFSKSLIEHLHNPLSFLRSCKKLIKENGVVVIMTPSWYHHQFGPFYLDHTHVTPFTLHSLRDLGGLAGFKKVSVKYFYQLPVLWKYPYLKFFSKIISGLKVPYHPMYEELTSIKWPDKINNYIKFSREVMLIAEMRN